jgi:hypothetical protein
MLNWYFGIGSIMKRVSPKVILYKKCEGLLADELCVKAVSDPGYLPLGVSRYYGETKGGG